MSAQIERRLVVCGPSWGIRCVAVLALLVAGTGTARGQTARSFEELRANGLLAVGDAATVEDVSGRTFRGTVDLIGDGSLTLRMDSARSRTEHVFSQADVRRIRRAGSHATAVLALAGAGAGFAVATGAAARYVENEGGRFCGACLAQWSIVTVPVSAGLGALIGLTIDKASVKTVYDARGQASSVSIVPIFTKRTLGGMASIRF